VPPTQDPGLHRQDHHHLHHLLQGSLACSDHYVELGLDQTGMCPSFAHGSLPSYLVVHGALPSHLVVHEALPSHLVVHEALPTHLVVHGTLPSHQAVLEVLAFHDLEWEVMVVAQYACGLLPLVPPHQVVLEGLELVVAVECNVAVERHCILGSLKGAAYPQTDSGAR